MEFSKTFKDALGREWTADITTATLRRLAQPPLAFRLDDVMPAKVDVKNPAGAVEKYQAFLDDDLRFADVLFAILKPDADKRGVSQDQFEEGLKGDANQRAIHAFHAAFTDFSQAPRKTVLRGLQLQMEKQSKVHSIASRKMDTEASLLTEAKMEEMIDGVIQHAKQGRIDGVSFGAPADPSSKPATDMPVISA